MYLPSLDDVNENFAIFVTSAYYFYRRTIQGSKYGES